MSQSIPFLAGTGVLAALTTRLADLRADRYLIIADRAVWALHGQSLLAVLPKSPGPPMSPPTPTHIIQLNAAESTKTLSTLDDLAQQALAAGASRQSVVISFGGGLTCNLAGMLAATLFRGLRLVQVPTTLLAMHDTVTSVKQAVNVGGFKNLLGLYHAPILICCDVNLLASLTPNAIQSALIEIVKNALILGQPFIQQARDLCAHSNKTDPNFALAAINSGVAAKRSLMLHDPQERTAALVFEYGHTVGHAIESHCADSLNHGQCVYWGMQAAAEIALSRTLLPLDAFNEHQRLLSLVGPVAHPANPIPLAALLDSLQFDNKRGHLPCLPNHIQMVLLRNIGLPAQTDALPLTQVPLPEIRQALTMLPFVDATAHNACQCPASAQCQIHSAPTGQHD